jgi:AraC-like DNA-binding protein
VPALRPDLLYSTQRVDDPRLGSWSYSAATPTGPLAAFVESFWAVESHGAYTRETIFPRAATEVFFNLGPPARLLRGRGTETYAGSWISGLHLRPFEIENDARASLIAIRLRPEGVRPFLGLPASEVAGEVAPLRDLLGSWIEEVGARLRETTGMRRRLSRLADFTARRFARTDPVSPTVRGALSALTARPAARVHELVRESGWSHRHFIARFRGEIGLAPKSFARIVRFERAVRRVDAVRLHGWAALALECGYADQSHMVNDFRELAGATPGEVLRRLSPDGTGLVPEELV